MKTRLLLILLIFFTISILVFIVPFYPVLSIRNRKNPAEKIYLPWIKNGFVVSYTHSVNKGRVHDYYKTLNGEFILYKTEFVSYGAGMPELEETPGAVFYKDPENNTYTMEYTRPVGKSFLLAVGVIAEHSIASAVNFSSSEKEFFLKDFFNPKTSLIFEVKRIPFIQLKKTLKTKI